MPKGQSKTSNRDKDQVSVFEEEVLHLITLNTITLIIDQTIFQDAWGPKRGDGIRQNYIKDRDLGKIWIKWPLSKSDFRSQYDRSEKVQEEKRVNNY